MKHRLFLFDLDDTLLDFKASERLCFAQVLAALGAQAPIDRLFTDYQATNLALWRQFERGQVTKEFLKVERFRSLFTLHGLDLDPEQASRTYLEHLAECVVLVDGAQAVCAELAGLGEVGIITNGIEQLQLRRIRSSGLADHISFVATSEACGHAKPDGRFFDFTVRKARAFEKASTVIVGDRLNADIAGGNQFGIESCWFNPLGLPNDSEARPTYEIDDLTKLIPLLRDRAPNTR